MTASAPWPPVPAEVAEERPLTRPAAPPDDDPPVGTAAKPHYEWHIGEDGEPNRKLTTSKEMVFVKVHKFVVMTTALLLLNSQTHGEEAPEVLHEYIARFPEATDWQYRRGEAWVNRSTGEYHSIAWLRKCSKEIRIGNAADAIFAASYLNYSDVKIRYIVILALNDYLVSQGVQASELPNASVALRETPEDYKKLVVAMSGLMSRTISK